MPSPLSAAILRTVVYADLFDCALTQAEIWRKLQAPQPTSLCRVKNQLLQLIKKQQLYYLRPYYTLPGRSLLGTRRRQRLKTSASKSILLENLIPVLTSVAWIEAIYLTGSLAARNADTDADIDLMIVTRPHHLWLVRLRLIFVTERLGYRRRPRMNGAKDRVCLNLFIDRSHLGLPSSRHNLYTAHEVIQAQLLFERHQTHHQFIWDNQWVTQYLPNGFIQDKLSIQSIPGPKVYWILINYLCYWAQCLYMLPKRTGESISLHHAFFHPHNTSARVLSRFAARKKQFGLV